MLDFPQGIENGALSVLALPLLIFGEKIVELTLSTVRTILVVSAMSIPAATVGFFEIAFGVVAMGMVVSHLDNPLAIFAYALGFSVGIVIGTRIEGLLAFGYRMVFIVNIGSESDVSTMLRDLGYRVTRLPGVGRSGSVEVAFTLIQRHAVPQLTSTLRERAPNAFITVLRTEHFVGGSLVDRRRGEGRWRGARGAGR